MGEAYRKASLTCLRKHGREPPWERIEANTYLVGLQMLQFLHKYLK